MKNSYFAYVDFFEEVFFNCPSVILYHHSGICVHMEQERITDLGTLPKACYEVPKYMPIAAGTMVLLNDPYSGGGILSQFSLLYGIDLHGQSKTQAEFLLGMKFSVRPHLSFAEKLDDEGLRIPPTPIYDQKSGPQSALIDAICSHPQAPEDLKPHLEKAIQQLQNLESELRAALKIWQLPMDQKNLEKYIHHCSERMSEVLTQFRPSKAKYKEHWITGESIAAELEKQERKLFFDFQEVSHSKLYHLNPAAVFGCCFAAVLNALESKLPINSGSMDGIDIKLPKEGFLNAKYPSPVYLGFTEASGLLANFTAKLLAKLNKDLLSAEGNIGCCSLDIYFPVSQKHYYDRLASGLGATENHDGATAIDKWSQDPLQASIEEIEKRFPLQIRSHGIRPGSGGNGQRQGGPGMIRSYRFLEAGEIRWFSAMTGHSPDGYGGASAGLGPQFVLVRGRDKHRLQNSGSMSLIEGDRLDILTAGGGGFGED